MTDNEIIKALEHCTSSTTSEACNGCPLFSTTVCTEMENGLMIYALNLINRQKAEIEELTKLLRSRHIAIEHLEGVIVSLPDEVRVEAIKEFAERLKKSAFACDVSFGYGKEHYTEAVAVVEIDNLVKEITESKDES